MTVAWNEQACNEVQKLLESNAIRKREEDFQRLLELCKSNAERQNLKELFTEAT